MENSARGMDDITIIDLDLKKTTWSRVHSSMRTLYLKLSAEPGLDWIRFFREERESRVVVKRHGLWIEDGYIVFDCLLPDVETHHLPDFRKSVAYANEKLRELKAHRRRESRQRDDDERDELARLAELREHVRTASAHDGAAANRSAPTRNGADRARAAGNAARSASAPPADPGFEKKRAEWRTRFRAALKSRKTESDRGND
jgi:hypothetical protein